jgi:hypothetical protein
MNTELSRTTVKLVNDALREEGINGKLRRGRGYFYFTGDEFHRCHSTSIYVYRVDAFNVESWVRQAKRMIEEAAL